MTIPSPSPRKRRQSDVQRQGAEDAPGSKWPEVGRIAIPGLNTPLQLPCIMMASTRQTVSASSPPPSAAQTQSRLTDDSSSCIMKTAQLLSASIHHFQNELDYLLSEWQTIQIVFESMRRAYAAMLAKTKDNSDSNCRAIDWVEADKELSVSYDDLMTQIRQLDKRLRNLTVEMKQTLSSFFG